MGTVNLIYTQAAKHAPILLELERTRGFSCVQGKGEVADLGFETEHDDWVLGLQMCAKFRPHRRGAGTGCANVYEI